MIRRVTSDVSFACTRLISSLHRSAQFLSVILDDWNRHDDDNSLLLFFPPNAKKRPPLSLLGVPRLRQVLVRTSMYIPTVRTEVL